jgi:hypothetical protein
MSSDIAYINYVKKENGKLISLTRASLLASLKPTSLYPFVLICLLSEVATNAMLIVFE